jgi:hypothetical protein
MSDHVDNENATIKRYGLHIGTVADIDDRKIDGRSLGRVRITIPGVHEPMGPWAWPLGTSGGGGPGQGAHVPMKVGWEVGVWFKEGDPDHPYYVAGHYGSPTGKGDETPTPIAALDPADAVRVAAFEFGRYIVVIDDREGHRGLLLQDKLSGDKVEHDGEKMSWMIKGTSALLLKADGQIDIDAPIVTIGGRPVGPGPEQL